MALVLMLMRRITSDPAGVRFFLRSPAAWSSAVGSVEFVAVARGCIECREKSVFDVNTSATCAVRARPE